MKLLNWLRGLLQPEGPKQTCFVYCPRCNLELCSSESVCFEVRGLTFYRCSDCWALSVWDFGTPAPILIYSAPKLEIDRLSAKEGEIP